MLPRKTKWTEADFVPPTDPPGLPDGGERPHPKDDDPEKHEWYRQEIRARLAAKVTPNEVIGWLLSEGLDSTTITWLMVWATTDDPPPMPRRSLDAELVIGAEVHSPSHPIVGYRLGVTDVQTDPVESSRARAESRRERAAEGARDPAPEFGFAKPADAAESWAAQHGPDMGNVIRAAILVIAIVTALVLGLIVSLLCG